MAVCPAQGPLLLEVLVLLLDHVSWEVAANCAGCLTNLAAGGVEQRAALLQVCLLARRVERHPSHPMPAGWG
jgi:hypothetical protein